MLTERNNLALAELLRGMPGGRDRNRRGLATKSWAKGKGRPEGGPVPGGISLAAR
ncbi:hypothetical protein QEV83_09110 [Methylocapsa sp. D3K7]|uniref:hypothetical protein n=1 Tax=Methylocapsa sp. D3K7 TaxID=3041435 RepID=UPI00244ED1C3|nr:hypothetical protein [Methylocapsa sp. D3K7]WGJ16370.1 hypothetical protein QEV83_09110 [Methylocapsa sp. D3K7]